MPIIDSVVVENEQEIVLFLVNRTEEKVSITTTHDFELETKAVQLVVKSDHLLDKNTKDAPNTIQPIEQVIDVNEKNTIHMVLEAYSWNVIRLKKCEEPL